MPNKQTFLLLLFTIFFGQGLFGGGRLEESDIPMPEIQYELPENLIGDFVLINDWADRGIKIFPNNKFITWQDDDWLIEDYGYVVKKESSWYLMPVAFYTAQGYYRQHPFLSDFILTEIILSDTGFSFNDRSNVMNRAIPKINIEETMIARDVSISWRRIRQQYYLFEQSNTQQIIDFVEIVDPFFSPYHPYHMFQIINGLVKIEHLFIRDNGTIGEFGLSWEGFFEKSDETPGERSGIIHFTNGVPFYYVKDGIAIIEIKGDDIIITIQCSDEEERRIREKYPEAQSPIFLVLEF